MIHRPPFILTAELDAASFSFFDELRKKYFPPAINYLNAHLTLFHNLANTDATLSQIAALAASTKPMELKVTGLMLLGRGVAYRIESMALTQVHKALQQVWQDDLTPQDRQPLRPHVTIQNKVDPSIAKALYAELNAKFQPFSGNATGLTVHEYLGGPWKKVKTYSFGRQQQ